MAVIEKSVVHTVKDEAGNTYILKPYTDVENVEGAVASVNGAKPNDAGEVSVNVGVKTINGQAPDAAGNANVDAGKVTIKRW